jgi:DNA uptake protein ComE-like DNA-binding protein
VRFVRSWWVLLALLGWLNWTAFLYAGLMSRNRRWLRWSGVYLALSAASLGLIIGRDPTGPADSWDEQLGAWIGLLSWGVSFVHALAVRKEFLERVEVLDDPALGAAEAKLRRRELARRLAAENPARARELGIGRPDVAGAFHGGLVDINHAPADTIDRLPGINKQLARRIVQVREEINGFSSLEDLGLVLNLPATLVDRMRARVVFLPRR